MKYQNKAKELRNTFRALPNAVTVLAVEADEEIEALKLKIEKASNAAANYAYIDGAHHKNWVINEMISAIQTDDERLSNGWNESEWLDECIAP